jgi:hypothetical protein
MIINGKLVSVWRKAVVAYFKVQSQHLIVDTEKKCEDPVRIVGDLPRFETCETQIQVRSVTAALTCPYAV